MYFSPPEKTGPTMRQRIQRVLDRGPVKGQIELGNQVLGTQWTWTEWTEFTDTLRHMLSPPKEVNEEKVQIPGTGHDGPPVFDYIYSKLKTPITL